MTPRVTISMPCYGRPERTKRAINCILDQDINGWEALIGGDGCGVFQYLIDTGFMEAASKKAAENGNSLIYKNHEHKGGSGYAITNYNIQNATGKYLVFFANDDIILPNHLRNYLQIENTDLDFMYFDSYVDPLKSKRDTKLAHGSIGHSEIIVKTEVAKLLPEHSPEYGHDWHFIQNLINNYKGAKSNSSLLSYRVMHVPSFGCLDVID